jgi:hypothetical protein
MLNNTAAKTQQALQAKYDRRITGHVGCISNDC